MQNPISLLRFSARKRLPVIRQTEAAECGLTCLAMVAGYHGHKTDLTALRRRYSVSLKGADLRTVMNTADQLHLSARPLRLDLAQMRQLKTPAILHWDMNHFVVLKRAGAKTIHIHDPARGPRELSYAEASRHFTGVALELTPNAEFTQKEETQKLKLADFWQRISGFKRVLVQVFTLSLLLQVFALAAPFYMQLVVDDVIVSHDSDLLLVLALGFLLLAIIRQATESLRSYVVLYLGSQLNIQMASNLFGHLLYLPLSWFQKRHIGDVVSRFGSLGPVRDLMSHGVVETGVDGVMGVATVVMLFIYSPMLAGVVLAVVALYLGIRLAMFGPQRRRAEAQIVDKASEESNFMETVRGIQSIKIFGQEPARQGLWQNRYADFINTGISVSKLGIGYKAINGLLFAIENVLVVYLGAKLVLDGQFSVGMLYAFMSYKGQFTSRAAALIEKVIAFRMLDLHLTRLADIALTEKEADLFSASDSPPISGAIELQQVSFRYADSEPDVLREVSLSIQAGECVAIVGPSGAGKTTLMKVMMGLLPATSGSVNADGADIRTLSLSHYRQQTAAVMQDDQLLSGSIADNIAFFSTEADDKRIAECAQLAAVHQDIQAMPMGYNSLIGDMGASLSGGQKQRVLLARALYRRPKILFLDEATSHLDVNTESIVNDAVKALNLTRIIIAHRPETIRCADRVLLLQNGQLVELAPEALHQAVA